MKRILLALLAAWLIAGPQAAFAHAFLAHASPAVGSTVKAAPTKLELWYTEGVEPAFSKVTVADADGQPVATGPLAADAGDKTHLVIPLPPLASGTYRVSWQAVSVDTHRTTGSFTFTVAP